MKDPYRSTPLGKVGERYMNDATFHAVVSLLEKQMLDLHLAPFEMRDAVMLAAMRIEMRRLPYLPMRDDANRELCAYCGHPPNSSQCQKAHA